MLWSLDLSCCVFECVVCSCIPVCDSRISLAEQNWPAAMSQYMLTLQNTNQGQCPFSIICAAPKAFMHSILMFINIENENNHHHHHHHHHWNKLMLWPWKWIKVIRTGINMWNSLKVTTMQCLHTFVESFLFLPPIHISMFWASEGVYQLCPLNSY